jgi:hypothetical protein
MKIYIYITVHMKSMHSKYWETRVESFDLRNENKNPHRKISVVGVIVGFKDFVIIVTVVIVVFVFVE